MQNKHTIKQQLAPLPPQPKTLNTLRNSMAQGGTNLSLLKMEESRLVPVVKMRDLPC